MPNQSLAILAGLLVLPMLGASGCATVVHGTTQTMDITSTPPGATATILPEGSSVTTPAKVELARKQVHTVLFKLEGYEPETVYVNKKVSAVTGGNLLLGGMVGAARDAQNGAAWDLDPNPVHAEMKPAKAARSPAN